MYAVSSLCVRYERNGASLTTQSVMYPDTRTSAVMLCPDNQMEKW